MIRSALISISVLFMLSLTPIISPFVSGVNAAETKTVVLDIPGMTCKLCPITIRKALKKVDGVIEATADFDSKTAKVTFDPAITDVTTLMKATANVGYPATLKQQETQP